jgi:SAM-dependent methyltransferase
LVAWCDKNLPFGKFSTNQLAPPFRYPDESFDFIYARSVFTHLPEDLQLSWMQELRRVLRRGGCVYFTTHGRPLSHGLTDKEKADFEAGKIVVTYSTLAGQNMCSTFSTKECVEQKLLRGFKLLDFVEGRNQEHFRQDIFLAMKE